MASDLRASRRERAEAYAQEAAEAARLGEHRKAAALYHAAFMALESDDEGERGEALGTDEPSRERQGDPEQAQVKVGADCLDEAG
jgi:hypothetical protein